MLITAMLTTCSTCGAIITSNSHVHGVEVHCFPVSLVRAATAPSTPLLSASPIDRSVPMGQSVTGSVLDTARAPAGASLSLTGFTVAGSSRVYTPGTTPITLTDTDGITPLGRLAITAGGAYTFVPERGYMGPEPAVNLYLRSSDGQTVVTALTIDVVPSEKKYMPYAASAALTVPGT